MPAKQRGYLLACSLLVWSGVISGSPKWRLWTGCLLALLLQVFSARADEVLQFPQVCPLDFSIGGGYLPDGDRKGAFYLGIDLMTTRWRYLYWPGSAGLQSGHGRPAVVVRVLGIPVRPLRWRREP